MESFIFRQSAISYEDALHFAHKYTTHLKLAMTFPCVSYTFITATRIWYNYLQ